MHNQILRSIILASTEVTLQNTLHTSRIPCLRIQTRARHVGNHAIAALHGVLGVAQGMVLGCGLREPDVAAVAVQVAGFEGFGYVFFDDDGAAGCVDEVGACQKLVG
jgi:hypothetical protein